MYKQWKVLVLTPFNLFCSSSSALSCCNCIWELSCSCSYYYAFSFYFFIPNKLVHAEDKLYLSAKSIFWSLQKRGAVICKQSKYLSLFPNSDCNLETVLSIFGVQIYQLEKSKSSKWIELDWFLCSSGFLDNPQMMGKNVEIHWRCAFGFWNSGGFVWRYCVFGCTLYREDPRTLSQSPSESILTFDKGTGGMFCFPQKGFKG